MNNAALRITIITSTLNCAASLAATADSIRFQTHGALQWIVADGGSVDGTIDVIRQNTDIIANWFSEPDTGIYAAWNKACRFIDGNWVIFLGAGDLLASQHTLSRVAALLCELPPTALIAYGNVVQRVAGEIMYRYGEVDLTSWELYRPALPPHQGTFHSAKIFQGVNPFDASYRVAGDSKLLLQVIRPEITHYIGIDVVEMEPGGISANPARSIMVMKEIFRLESDIGYRIPFGRRSWFILRSYIKFAMFRLVGTAAVSGVALLKKRLVGGRESSGRRAGRRAK